MEIREIAKDELTEKLFSGFVRRQEVTQCYRRADSTDSWHIEKTAFVDDWGAKEYAFLCECLLNTLALGGAVFGAFEEKRLVGFASLEAEPYGTSGQYRDLTSLHVSEDLRRRGIGRALFMKAAERARENYAEKLYISSHSAVETQCFYRALGCVDAKETLDFHVEREPFDCQLEYKIGSSTQPETEITAELFAVKCGRAYLRAKPDGATLVALNKASVFGDIKSASKAAKDSEISAVRIVKLTLKETELTAKEKEGERL